VTKGERLIRVVTVRGRLYRGAAFRSIEHSRRRGGKHWSIAADASSGRRKVCYRRRADESRSTRMLGRQCRRGPSVFPTRRSLTSSPIKPNATLVILDMG